MQRALPVKQATAPESTQTLQRAPILTNQEIGLAARDTTEDSEEMLRAYENGSAFSGVWQYNTGDWTARPSAGAKRKDKQRIRPVDRAGGHRAVSEALGRKIGTSNKRWLHVGFVLIKLSESKLEIRWNSISMNEEGRYMNPEGNYSNRAPEEFHDHIKKSVEFFTGFEVIERGSE